MYKKIILLVFFSIEACYSEESLLTQKTVFITGAAGFVGSNFLSYMFEKYKNYQFLVLDALTYAGNLDNIPSHIQNSERLTFVHGSVCNQQFVDRFMHQADFVIHFAAETHVTRSISDDYVFFDTDVMGTRVMMTSLVKYHKQVERYVHISTSEVYGTALTKPITEEHILNPHTPYAAAKAGADRLVYAYWKTYNIPAVILRPFNMYGPRQHLEKMIPRFITTLLEKEKITVHGDGLQTRDWLHVSDFCIALDTLLHYPNFNKIQNQIINIGPGRETSVLEIAQTLLNLFNLPEEFIEYGPHRPGQIECHISSTDKAQNLIGWEPKKNLKEGLEQTIQWYKTHEHMWKNQESCKTTKLYRDSELLGEY